MSIKHHFHGCQKRRWYMLRLLSGAISSTWLFFTPMYRSVATAPTQSIDAARFLANNSSRHLIPSVTASRYGCCNWAVGTPWRRTNDYHSASLAQALRVFLSADLTKASAPYASTAAITAVNHFLDNIQRLPRDSWRAILIDRTACRHDRLLFKR